MAYTIVTDKGVYHFTPARANGKSLWDLYRVTTLATTGEEPEFKFVEVDINQDDETEICLQDT